jgi:hypothetical protein
VDLLDAKSVDADVNQIQLLRGHSLLRHSLASLAESVLEATRHSLHVTHAASAGCTAALGLLAPLVATHGRVRVRARTAHTRLDVERLLTASRAQDVCLARTLSERAGSLGHCVLEGEGS